MTQTRGCRFLSFLCRDGVTAESLGKLKPAFSKTGTTHAGNASQVSDGAAAVLLARRSIANKLSLPILGKFVSAAVVGVPPNIMGLFSPTSWL
jgi:acetyl-CoA acyltransferase 1